MNANKIRRAISYMDEFASRQKVVVPNQGTITLLVFSEEAWGDFKDLIEEALSDDDSRS